MKFKIYILAFLFSVVGSKISHAQNQGMNNLWLMGYQSWAGPPTGGIEINYVSGSPIVSSANRSMDLLTTTSNIADTSGNLLFYTNGYWIADVSGDTMFNGSGLAPTDFMNIEPYGLTVSQACLIIPMPGNDQKFLLFHSTLDTFPFQLSMNLFATTIDMSINGGFGGVTIKNQVILSDSLNAGKISACRHANGRDWWIVVLRAESDIIYKILVTPNGIGTPKAQHIGNYRIATKGQVTFSPNGSRYAFYYTLGGLELFDFDRCSGDFSNAIFIPTANYNYHSGGVAFSPNSQLVYISDVYKVFQYDLTATNIGASQTMVAQWDSFYSPQPPFSTLFDLSELGPDGKIYISSGNSTFHLHVINSPDNSGLSCDVIQHGLSLPFFYSNSVPNHPNYFLGKIPGSPCDTVWGVGLEEPQEIVLKVWPNPVVDDCAFSFPVHSGEGALQVFDLLGSKVFEEPIAPWSQFKRVSFKHLSKGMYLCRMSWGDKIAIVKVMRE